MAEIKETNDFIILDDVTTNTSLMAKASIKCEELILPLSKAI